MFSGLFDRRWLALPAAWSHSMSRVSFSCFRVFVANYSPESRKDFESSTDPSWPLFLRDKPSLGVTTGASSFISV